MIFKTKWNISKLTLYNIFKFQETFYAYLIYILYSTSFAFFPHKKIIPHRTQSIRRIFFLNDVDPDPHYWIPPGSGSIWRPMRTEYNQCGSTSLTYCTSVLYIYFCPLSHLVGCCCCRSAGRPSRTRGRRWWWTSPPGRSCPPPAPSRWRSRWPPCCSRCSGTPLASTPSLDNHTIYLKIQYIRGKKSNIDVL